MASHIEGFEYDIFISYRQKDNKYDGWVTRFVGDLKRELEATFKEDISIYFDENPQDGLLEMYNVDKSLEGKLKSLIFIPIISQTYCDLKSFAWQYEFCAFNAMAKEDQFGRDIRLGGGNVTSRILPVKINDLDPEDKNLLAGELGGILRPIEFIYKEPGVNRPLTPDDDEKKNLNKTRYRNQINKTANAIKEIITAIKKTDSAREESSGITLTKSVPGKRNISRILVPSIILIVMLVLGYLFIPRPVKSEAPQDKSIAVLPFVNLSNDNEQEYFCDGMVDAILDHLFKAGDLKVISRTSSMRYKGTKLSLREIGNELNVSSILEGSVQKIGNRIRITIQLIDTKTDTHLWSDIFEGEFVDLFAFQSNVASAVARELKVTMASRETDFAESAVPTNSTMAYDFYLRGNDYWSRYDANMAIDMYSKAIEEDSVFESAYAKRALMHLFLYWHRQKDWSEHKVKGVQDLEKAIEINPDLTEVKLSLAVKFYFFDRDYEKSLKILDELKETSPGNADLYHWTAAVMRRQGQMVESATLWETAIKMDPFNALYISNLTQTYQLLHQYDKVDEWARRGLALIPDYESFKLILFNSLLSKTGDMKLAMDESGLKIEDVTMANYFTRQFEKREEILFNLYKEDTYVGDQFRYTPPVYLIAHNYHLSGNKALCMIYADSSVAFLRDKLKEIPDDDRYYATLGKSYALSGNYTEAFACGKKAIELKPVKLDAFQGPIREQEMMEIYLITGNYDMALEKIEYLLSIPSWLSPGILKIDPIFDNLRRLPGFKKIINSYQKEPE